MQTNQLVFSSSRGAAAQTDRSVLARAFLSIIINWDWIHNNLTSSSTHNSNGPGERKKVAEHAQSPFMFGKSPSKLLRGIRWAAVPRILRPILLLKVGYCSSRLFWYWLLRSSAFLLLLFLIFCWGSILNHTTKSAGMTIFVGLRFPFCLVTAGRKLEHWLRDRP